MTKTSTSASVAKKTDPSTISHDDYHPMLAAIQVHFAPLGNSPLFTTDVDGRELWSAWLMQLPVKEQQHHNCHSCRQFVERYGNLASIHPVTNELTSAFFGTAPGMYEASSEICRSMVEGAKVTGVFVSAQAVLGTPVTPDGKRAGVTWYHMNVHQAEAARWKGKILNAPQRAAELLEEHATLCRALAEFTPEVVKQALAITEAEALYRGEKIAGRLRWLAALQDVPKTRRANAIWRAVATAPAGFCHVRSSVIGPLLEDLTEGKPFEAVKRAFDAKMSPTQYQRPQAPPSLGNIKQAEEIVEKMGIRASLGRRFARLDDLQVTTWLPSLPALVPGAPGGGVFDHLRNVSLTSPSALVVQAPVMTWEKFAREVLPRAEEITALVPNRGGFHALVTAVDPTAPPIIQWDSPEKRNPVTWYVYQNGSQASQWGLVGGTRVRVTAITPMPNQWQPGFGHQGEGVVLVLEGCKDTLHSGLSLFPEFLRSELHAVRSTIEAHSHTGQLEGAKDASACGLAVRKGSTMHERIILRVTSRGTTTEYPIDRWD